MGIGCKWLYTSKLLVSCLWSLKHWQTWWRANLHVIWIWEVKFEFFVILRLVDSSFRYDIILNLRFAWFLGHDVMHVASLGVVNRFVGAWFILVQRSWRSWNAARFAGVKSILRRHIWIDSFLSLIIHIIHSRILLLISHSIGLNLISWSHLIPPILWAWGTLWSHHVLLMLSTWWRLKCIWVGSWSHRWLTVGIWIWNFLTFPNALVSWFLTSEVWRGCRSSIVVINARLGRYLRNLLG